VLLGNPTSGDLATVTCRDSRAKMSDAMIDSERMVKCHSVPEIACRYFATVEEQMNRQKILRFSAMLPLA
jgi:hypothetical protein